MSSSLQPSFLAYNSARTDDLGRSPFEVDLGYVPMSPVDKLRAESTEHPTSQEFRERQSAAMEHALQAHAVAKAKQAAEASGRYRPHPYQPGDRVWLSRRFFTDDYARARISRKLSARRFGPYEVEALVGRNAVKLALPDDVKIHPVFHVILTCPFHAQPPDIAVEEPPLLEPVGKMEGEDL